MRQDGRGSQDDRVSQDDHISHDSVAAAAASTSALPLPLPPGSDRIRSPRSSRSPHSSRSPTSTSPVDQSTTLLSAKSSTRHQHLAVLPPRGPMVHDR